LKLGIDTIKAFQKGKNTEEFVVRKIINVFEKVLESKEYVILRNTHFLKDELDSKVSTEEDIILMHPVFGIKLIQVKSKNKPKDLTQDLSQIKHGEKVLHNFVDKYIETYSSLRKRKIKKLISTFLIYPNLSKEKVKSEMPEFSKELIDNPHIFLMEDFKDDYKFIEKLLYNPHLDDKDTFKDIAMIMQKLIQYAKEFNVKIEGTTNREIIPVITANQIVFFDKTQMKIVKEYKKGSKIIRGLAGTGKTFIAENLIKKLSQNSNNEILVLTFNSEINKSLDNKFKEIPNVKVLTFFSLATELEILPSRIKKFNKRIQITSTTSSELWKEKLEDYKSTKSISHLIIDESQDIPKNFLKAAKDVFENIIIFIDEAQATNQHSITNINNDVFEQSRLGAKVSNLYTIYRTPSLIMELALDILLLDESLPRYFKNIEYVNTPSKTYEELTSRCIFQGGEIKICYETNEISKFFEISGNSAVFVSKKEHINEVENIFGKNVNIYTYESVKGLEFDNVLLYKFPSYLSILLNARDPKTFRKLYVVLSRASNSLTIHWDKKSIYIRNSLPYFRKESIGKTIDDIYNIIVRYNKKFKENLLNPNNISKDKKIYTLDIDKNKLIALKEFTSNFILKTAKIGHILEGTAYLGRLIENSIRNIF